MFSKPATKKDINFILSNLRDQDKDELFAKYGKSWRKITYKNIRLLDETTCHVGCTDDKKPVLIYGIVPCNDVGVIWMLSVKNIDKEIISFLKQSKKFVNGGMKKFSMLCNFVHSKNTFAIEWLEWLGFKVESSEVIGLGRKKFLFFFKEAKNV